MRASGVGWLWTDRGLFATVDRGQTWTIIAYDNPDASTPIVSAMLVGEHAGFALVRNGVQNEMNLVKTDDDGHTWAIVGSWPLR